MFVVLFLAFLSFPAMTSANTECAWVIGKLVCSNEENLANAVVEVYDLDRPKFGRLNVLDTDDLAGRTVVAKEENGIFKVEGCASDFDWLGPAYTNRPEFFLKVRHSCKGKPETLTLFPPDMRVYAPQTMDYYLNNPILLD
ncbi:unnamed protein product [Caenorhabditis auriculariae]|uniref:Transthyretin-like family protein n=1 Tax=Caenorhabditis auriculariae TaxID=2777116 RepID=A0A8S1HNR8_9PELO|nr:unnamed protein product [Caenorhabditis auriculariae]